MSSEQPSQNQQDKAAPSSRSEFITLGTTRRGTSMWAIVLSIYLLLLGTIGYVAFWEQDFNKPEKVIGTYIDILNNYKESTKHNDNLSDEELTAVIQELMQRDADNAGDLQELASQSFNIVLGAILAFLSASATLIFQHARSEKDDD